MSPDRRTADTPAERADRGTDPVEIPGLDPGIHDRTVRRRHAGPLRAAGGATESGEPGPSPGGWMHTRPRLEVPTNQANGVVRLYADVALAKIVLAPQSEHAEPGHLRQCGAGWVDDGCFRRKVSRSHCRSCRCSGPERARCGVGASRRPVDRGRPTSGPHPRHHRHPGDRCAGNPDVGPLAHRQRLARAFEREEGWPHSARRHRGADRRGLRDRRRSGCGAHLDHAGRPAQRSWAICVGSR